MLSGDSSFHRQQHQDLACYKMHQIMHFVTFNKVHKVPKLADVPVMILVVFTWRPKRLECHDLGLCKQHYTGKAGKVCSSRG